MGFPFVWLDFIVGLGDGQTAVAGTLDMQGYQGYQGYQ
jgi:hypothetical protein